MANKSKIRFVVEFEGQLRRVISIGEGSSDDLIVVTHSQGLLNILRDGELKPIKEYRHAIHVSPQTDGNLIHRVTVHDDGTRQDTYLATNAIRDGRLQPVYVRVLPRLQVLPILELPAKGEVAKLPSFDPAGCTMYYTVWVSSREVGERFNIPSQFTIEKRLFRYFAILFAYCYAPKPSRDHGAIIEYVTESEERETAEHAEMGLRTGPAEGCIALSVPAVMVRNFNQIDAPRPMMAGFSPDNGPVYMHQPFLLFANPVVWK
jgi:hypothetical protein